MALQTFQINSELCHILGIDPHSVQSVQINLEPGKPPRISVARWVYTLGQTGPALTERAYDLVPRDDGPAEE